MHQGSTDNRILAIKPVMRCLAIAKAERPAKLKIASQVSGDHSEGEPPGPIPNPEVKPFSADGTALETGWESRSSPGFFKEGVVVRRPPSFLSGSAPNALHAGADRCPKVFDEPLGAL